MASSCGTGGGQRQLITAFAQSCDTTFGNIGMTLGRLGAQQLRELFGMNDKNLTIPMLVTPSNYVIPPSKALTALLGDRPVQRHRDPAAGGHVRRGHRQRRHADEAVPGQAGHRPDLSTVDTTSPQAEPGGLPRPWPADLGQMMIAVVQDPDGTAHALQHAAPAASLSRARPGPRRTASTTPGSTTRSSPAFAPDANPQIAVGVIIQGGGYGAAAAAPIAVQVIKAYLASLGNRR